jgi:hypothetical protein
VLLQPPDAYTTLSSAPNPDPTVPIANTTSHRTVLDWAFWGHNSTASKLKNATTKPVTTTATSADGAVVSLGDLVYSRNCTLVPPADPYAAGPVTGPMAFSWVGGGAGSAVGVNVTDSREVACAEDGGFSFSISASSAPASAVPTAVPSFAEAMVYLGLTNAAGVLRVSSGTNSYEYIVGDRSTDSVQPLEGTQTIVFRIRFALPTLRTPEVPISPSADSTDPFVLRVQWLYHGPPPPPPTPPTPPPTPYVQPTPPPTPAPVPCKTNLCGSVKELVPCSSRGIRDTVDLEAESGGPSGGGGIGCIGGTRNCQIERRGCCPCRCR